MAALKDRIAIALGRKPGVRPADLARACEVSTASVADWMNGETKSLRPKAARLAAQFFGCSQAWIGEGIGEPGWADEAPPPLLQLSRHPDFRGVSRVDIRPTLGSMGYEVAPAIDEPPPIVLRSEWFTTHGYTPERLLAIRVTGGAMEPTLYDHDLVIINTEHTTARDGRAFALIYAGEVIIRRLAFDLGGWALRADSQDKVRYPDKRVVDGLAIVGEVVYRQSERI